MNPVEALDELIDQLDKRVASDASPVETLAPEESSVGDAIDRVLASSPRRSSVRSLREDDAVVNFRRELVDGLIRVDTAGQVLQLLSQVVGAVLTGRA